MNKSHRKHYSPAVRSALRVADSALEDWDLEWGYSDHELQTAFNTLSRPENVMFSAARGALWNTGRVVLED